MTLPATLASSQDSAGQREELHKKADEEEEEKEDEDEDEEEKQSLAEEIHGVERVDSIREGMNKEFGAFATGGGVRFSNLEPESGGFLKL